MRKKNGEERERQEDRAKSGAGKSRRRRRRLRCNGGEMLQSCFGSSLVLHGQARRRRTQTTKALIHRRQWRRRRWLATTATANFHNKQPKRALHKRRRRTRASDTLFMGLSVARQSLQLRLRNVTIAIAASEDAATVEIISAQEQR